MLILCHLHESYTKMLLEHTAINTNHFICIVTKEVFKRIKNIAYNLQDRMQFELRIDINVHAITVTDTYTSFSNTNKQIVLSQC